MTIKNETKLGPLEGYQMFEGTHYYITEPLTETKSEKDIVVCIHGIGSFSRDFDDLTLTLEANGFNCVKYDLIGRGYSIYPEDHKFDGPAHVKQLRELLVGIHVASPNQKYHLVSHSMGGALATLYCEEFGTEVASMTLLAPAGLIDLGPLKIVRSCPTFLRVAIKSLLKLGNFYFY